MRIALFGGSFDPPHWGHVLAAGWAKVAGAPSGPIDEVWVLPVARHPYGKPLAPWDQRWALCQAAFAPLPYVRLRDDEQGNASGFTFDLLAGLRSAHPEHSWALIGGTDTARDLLNWHRGAELARQVEVIAVPRRGYDDHPAALPEISSSAIRARAKAGEGIDQLVPGSVAALIASNGWYR